ncbi:MAG: restriction endonuclease subunit S [Gammaproteobacteria bacterium]|nr:restriction endonuclease subunit S [Gammaproteobacteria bacterium]
MEVRPRYRHTEVGAIPDDWTVKPLGEIAAVHRGASPRPIDSPIWFDEASTIGWVRISDVTRSSRRLTRTTQRLSRRGVERSRFIPSGSLIMSIAATVGRPIVTSIDVCIHDGFVVFERPIADQTFLYYVLAGLEKNWGKLGQTGSQMNLNTGIIDSTPVPLPPTKGEQEAIAEALSNADGLIESLEQLLAKKRQLKQGAMQELLTGKKRLPGFSGEWETRRITDMAALSKAGLNPGLSPKAVFTHFSLPAFDASAVPVVEEGASIGSNKFVVPPDSVLLSKLNPRIPRIWAPPRIPSNAVCSTEFLVLVPREGTDREFLATVCRSAHVANQMKLHAIGTTGSHQRINPSQVLAIEVSVPRDRGEQAAITDILSDMDAEIAALEVRLAKAHQLKQGMMHELLTGKIRLV